MAKNKKLELLTGLVEEFGLSFDDVVSFWTRKGKLKPNKSTVSTKDTTSATSQITLSEKYKAPHGVLPGMYVYTDGLISTEIIAGRQIKAVIGAVSASEILALCLDEEELRANGYYYNGVSAAQWCRNYAKYGVKQGEAFLPSADQLVEIGKSRLKINKSLVAIKADKFSYFWH